MTANEVLAVQNFVTSHKEDFTIDDVDKSELSITQKNLLKQYLEKKNNPEKEIDSIPFITSSSWEKTDEERFGFSKDRFGDEDRWSGPRQVIFPRD